MMQNMTYLKESDLRNENKLCINIILNQTQKKTDFISYYNMNPGPL